MILFLINDQGKTHSDLMTYPYTNYYIDRNAENTINTRLQRTACSLDIETYLDKIYETFTTDDVQNRRGKWLIFTMNLVVRSANTF